MSHKAELYETIRERIEENIFEELFTDMEVYEDFMVWMQDNLHKDQFQTFLNEWLKTPGAQKLFEKRIDWLMEEYNGGDNE